MSPTHLLVGGPSGWAAAAGAGSVDTQGLSPAVGQSPGSGRACGSTASARPLPPAAGRAPILSLVKSFVFGRIGVSEGLPLTPGF